MAQQGDVSQIASLIVEAAENPKVEAALAPWIIASNRSAADIRRYRQNRERLPGRSPGRSDDEPIGNFSVKVQQWPSGLKIAYALAQGHKKEMQDAVGFFPFPGKEENPVIFLTDGHGVFGKDFVWKMKGLLEESVRRVYRPDRTIEEIAADAAFRLHEEALSYVKRREFWDRLLPWRRRYDAGKEAVQTGATLTALLPAGPRRHCTVMAGDSPYGEFGGSSPGHLSILTGTQNGFVGHEDLGHGPEECFEPQAEVREIAEGGRWFLMSDGLSHLSQAFLATLLGHRRISVEQTASLMIMAGLLWPKDNMAVLVGEYEK